MATPGTTDKYRTGLLFTPADAATFSYLILTLVYILIFFGRIPHGGMHIGIRLGMIMIMVLLVILHTKYPSRILAFFRDLYPLIFLAFFFYETDSINNIFLANIDPWLVRADQHIFGFLPSEILCQRYPWHWLSELMHLGYFSFYFIILFFCFGYYVKRPQLFASRFFVFLQSFYIFYLIFIFIPSEGPQYFFTANTVVQPSPGIFSRLVQMVLQMGDRPTGAFPSSHVGMTWLILFFFLKDNRRWFLLWLVPGLLLTFSTVYIRAHYAVDVFGGVILAILLFVSGLIITPIIDTSERSTRNTT